MDKLFVEYYGNVVGINTIAAIEEGLGPRSCVSSALANDEETVCNRGNPITPSRFLMECLRNKHLKHVAGHGQHDSQEFFNCFIDRLAAHAMVYQKSAQEKRKIIPGYEPQINQNHRNETPIVQSIENMFVGTLRSVLICQACGCNRVQSESFSSISLPLAKELPENTHTEGKGPNTRRGNMSVERCLSHFTRPEELVDLTNCSSCKIKTQTLKQHTFARAPEVMCLHLKRFDAARNRKITDFVKFPLNLDMGKYLPIW